MTSAAARRDTPSPITVPVPLGDRAYDILVGRGLIETAGSRIAALGARAAAIVTDEHVGPLYADALARSLEAQGLRVSVVTLPPGEATKSYASLERVCDAVLAAKIERGDLVVALGGGVVGDLAGFAAAVVRRGVRFVQVPTTLLSQVDSSVGGKTGINSRHGKNLVGAFHQPSLVLADTALLDTLPLREMRAGYAEVAKYGLIDDARFFAWCEANWQGIFAGGPERDEAVAQSCRAKADVVVRDEHETGDRALLNLGHTFGHALEKITCLRFRPPRPWRGCRHRPHPRLPLLRLPRACAGDRCRARREASEGRRAPHAPRRCPGRLRHRRSLARRDGAGQEGEGRRADLHPRPRHRAELHRARHRPGQGPRLPGKRNRRIAAMIDDSSGDLWLAALVVVFCLLLSAFFSAGETAFTGASRSRMLVLEKGGDKRAKQVNRLLEMRERFIGTVLIGNNIVNIGVSAFATSVLVAIFGQEGAIYATVIMSVLVIVFAEVLPKTVAISSPETASLFLSRPMSWAVSLLGPLAIAIERIVKLMLLPFGIRIGENTPILSASEEIRGQVALLHKEGGVAKVERDMLGGLLDLEDLTVSEVMVHRTKMRTINADLSSEEIVREVLSSPYTRLPLWRESQENIVGVLHAKDLLRALDAVGGDAGKLKVEAIALETWFVPDTTSLKDQLKAFLAKKTHFALVVDEYGEVMGLVTLEDILEEIVGDIKDEHDLSVQGVRPQPNGSVNVDGSVPIRDLNRAMDWNLPDDEATTIAGLVIHKAQTIPDTGQIFTFDGYRFQVLRKSRNRIMALRITPLTQVRARAE